ncbi:PTK9 protein tyrosine kinase 9 [Clonorchis sinensis]|uniref:PTK9 protein tyrosine kinase 9 n=1 Tax=Clonorchis sinensis TaxID=79923 RepID=G7YGC0_CLOSI|nr:PTK9 protein tyrosine kinase 9 [Clonorchis sinensis]
METGYITEGSGASKHRRGIALENPTADDTSEWNSRKGLYLKQRGLSMSEDFHVLFQVSGGFYGARPTGSSLQFGLTNRAAAELQRFASGLCNYVQLLIDMDCEMIDLALSEKQVEANRIVSHTPSNEGRYHLYRFCHHTYQQNPPVFFIHSISGYQSSVKSRMLYSSCKSSLISMLENQYGILIGHRLEIDDMKELTTDYLLDILNPKPLEPKKKFDKPQGPTGRRPHSRFVGYAHRNTTEGYSPVSLLTVNRYGPVRMFNPTYLTVQFCFDQVWTNPVSNWTTRLTHTGGEPRFKTAAPSEIHELTAIAP